MKKTIIIIILILTNCFSLGYIVLKNKASDFQPLSELRYPVVGTYIKKSAQGMAIYGDNAYLFNDGGHCRVYNLITEEVIKEFDLASAGDKTHVNAACFGNEIINDNTIPVIYISEYKRPSRCFVENITEEKSILVQTIQAKENNNNMFIQSWIVDTMNENLYAIVRQTPPEGEENSDLIRIMKYRLPKLNEGDMIFLTEKDILDEFFVNFASGTQGGIINGKYMLLPTGLNEGARGAFNAKRVLKIIDLEKKNICNQIDLTYVTTNEPEDVDFYKDKLLLYCGQQGGIYNISNLLKNIER